MTPNPRRGKAKAGSSVRVAVVRALCRIDEGESGSQEEVHVLAKQFKDSRDRGLATELLYSSLRYAPAFLKELDTFLKRGVEKTNPKMVWCLILGMVQLRILDRMPVHAAVGASVDAARVLCGASGSKLVNAILRRVQREMGERPDLPPPMECYAPHLLRAFEDLPSADVEQAALSYLGRAPHVVRGLGEHYGKVSACLSLLEGAGIRGAAEGRVPGSIILPSGGEALAKEFKGRWIPQDAASQAVGRLAGTFAESLGGKSAKVLDVCAGRGVKTEQIRAILGAEAQIVAADRGKEKLQEARRLVEADFFVGDMMRDLPTMKGGFDLVFVDAPCSGLGVLRRRPEIRLRRSAEDLESLSRTQASILKNVSRALRPGGVLLYAVCTFTRAEGAQQAERFLQSEAGRSFESSELPAPPEKAWASSDGSWCTYDDVSGSLADTFYVAAFQRKT